MALRIASPFGWRGELVRIHNSLALLFCDEGEFEDANAHVERAKLHAVDNAYHQGHAMKAQAGIWYRQHRLEDARSEALCALEIFEKLGAAQDVGFCRESLLEIQKAMARRSISDIGGEFSGYDATSSS